MYEPPPPELLPADKLAGGNQIQFSKRGKGSGGGWLGGTIVWDEY